MSVTVVEQANRLTVTGDDPPTLTVTQVIPRLEVSSTGPQGIPGPQGPAGDASGLGFVHHQASPVTLVQINHGMPFQPAGVICMATGDTVPLLGVGVSYPMAGYIELSFGFQFTGDIFLS